MAVTLSNGGRFAVEREPLGLTMKFAWPTDAGWASMSAYVDFAELSRPAATPLQVLRWYRRLLVEHVRTFHPARAELRKHGRWARGF